MYQPTPKKTLRLNYVDAYSIITVLSSPTGRTRKFLSP